MKSHIILAGLLGLSWFNISFAEDGKGEDQYLSRVRQLTFEGRRSGEGYYSPDGKTIIFQSEREKGNPFYQIYTMSLESGDVTRVPGPARPHAPFSGRAVMRYCLPVRMWIRRL